MLLEVRIVEYLHDLKVGKDFLEHKQHKLYKKNTDFLNQHDNGAHQKKPFREG